MESGILVIRHPGGSCTSRGKIACTRRGGGGQGGQESGIIQVLVVTVGRTVVCHIAYIEAMDDDIFTVKGGGGNHLQATAVLTIVYSLHEVLFVCVFASRQYTIYCAAVFCGYLLSSVLQLSHTIVCIFSSINSLVQL